MAAFFADLCLPVATVSSCGVFFLLDLLVFDESFSGGDDCSFRALVFLLVSSSPSDLRLFSRELLEDPPFFEDFDGKLFRFMATTRMKTNTSSKLRQDASIFFVCCCVWLCRDFSRAFSATIHDCGTVFYESLRCSHGKISRHTAAIMDTYGPCQYSTGRCLLVFSTVVEHTSMNGFHPVY